MDEYYEMFLSELGPAHDMLQPTNSQIKEFEGKLPQQLIEYWRLYGWSGFHNGLFWIVNPEEYVTAVDVWLENTSIENKREYYAIARTAFGRVFLWNKNTGQNVTLVPLNSQIITSPANKNVQSGDDTIALRSFLIGKDSKNLDIEDVKEKKLFQRALKKLGRLKPDEMYGFEPALCLGGLPILDNLRKVKIIAHLVLLEQLGEVEIMHLDVTRHL